MALAPKTAHVQAHTHACTQARMHVNTHTHAHAQIWVLLFGGIGTAALLDFWVGHEVPIMVALAVFGSFISYIYSAPPLKLKQWGWAGNYALGSSYIALPWWAGQALFGTLTPDVMVLTVLYSMAGLGIAIVNDFKVGGSVGSAGRRAGRSSWTISHGVSFPAFTHTCAHEPAQKSRTGMQRHTHAMYTHDHLCAFVCKRRALPDVDLQHHQAVVGRALVRASPPPRRRTLARPSELPAHSCDAQSRQCRTHARAQAKRLRMAATPDAPRAHRSQLKETASLASSRCRSRLASTPQNGSASAQSTRRSWASPATSPPACTSTRTPRCCSASSCRRCTSRCDGFATVAPLSL
eukprot:351062-Chlamydomonas_euryale.AAC.3